MRKNRVTEDRGGTPVFRRFLCAACLILALAGTAVFPAAAEEAGTLRGYDKDSKTYTYVLFGQYPQEIDGGNPDDGTQTWQWRAEHQKKETIDESRIRTTPILWRVLAADEEKVFLCSEYVLFASPMHSDYPEYVKEKGRFEKTELYAKLNGPFADIAFTEEEKGMLVQDAEGGTVSLLTAANLNDKSLGFGTNKARKARATEYAIRVTGAFVYRIQMGNHSPYWVQDQSSSDPRHARCTKQEGTIGRINVITEDEGARPVIWLRSGSYTLESGSGTREDPYVVVPR